MAAVVAAGFTVVVAFMAVASTDGGFAGHGYGGRSYGHRRTAFYGPLIYDGYGGDECYWRGRRWVCTY